MTTFENLIAVSTSKNAQNENRSNHQALSEGIGGWEGAAAPPHPRPKVERSAKWTKWILEMKNNLNILKLLNQKLTIFNDIFGKSNFFRHNISRKSYFFRYKLHIPPQNSKSKGDRQHVIKNREMVEFGWRIDFNVSFSTFNHILALHLSAATINFARIVGGWESITYNLIDPPPPWIFGSTCNKYTAWHRMPLVLPFPSQNHQWRFDLKS